MSNGSYCKDETAALSDLMSRLPASQSEHSESARACLSSALVELDAFRQNQDWHFRLRTRANRSKRERSPKPAKRGKR